MTDLPNKPLLRPDEVAAFFSVTRKTVMRWVKKGDLIAKKKGGTVRITKNSVLECPNLSQFVPICPSKKSLL